MPVSLIAAVSKNNCIGKNNSLPWHLPEDLKRFKELTINKIVLMGRKTWESLPDKFKPLPKRKNIVITRDKEYSVPEEVEVYNSIEQALEKYKNDDIVIIGGAQIYSQTINKADVLYITQVHKQIEGDAFFPEIDKEKWMEVEKEDYDEYSFVKYVKQ